MSAKKVKKTCSKAKREKEILRDLEKLEKQIKIEDAAAEKARDEGIARVHEKMAMTFGKRVVELEQELHDLWTLPPLKKRRALRRSDPT